MELVIKLKRGQLWHFSPSVSWSFSESGVIVYGVSDLKDKAFPREEIDDFVLIGQEPATTNLLEMLEKVWS